MLASLEHLRFRPSYIFRCQLVAASSACSTPRVLHPLSYEWLKRSERPTASLQRNCVLASASMSAKAMLSCVLAACAASSRAERTQMVMAPDAASLLDPLDLAVAESGGDSLMSVVSSAVRALATNQTVTPDAAVTNDAPPEVSPTAIEKAVTKEEATIAGKNTTVEKDPVEDLAEHVEGSLEYKALDDWRTAASGQVDGVVSQERDQLDPAATEGLRAAEKYAQMLKGLGNGFDTFRGALADFRAANRGLQGRQNQEVRETLQAARAEAEGTVNATGTPGVAPEKLDVVKHEVTPEVVHEAKAVTESDVEDITREADKLTGHSEGEVAEEDALESGSVVRKETAKEAADGLANIEEQIKNGEVTADTAVVEESVKKLVAEEEEQQNRITTACFALADSPLSGDKRTCKADVVNGIIEKNACEGHDHDLKAACNAASKCESKHVCVKDGTVVADTDGSWKVNDSPTCEAGDAESICVPKAGSYKLPVAP
ncbi:unnamed protein product [Prorocentrum cordatum]|uniref:Uncharacterized protein n=1 Tax=Prorocentrum cordatum TaxID=2364126 RepID=A0ABN9UR00_9DINO|nr:unnamed protein product [Polarella glacialis]